MTGNFFGLMTTGLAGLRSFSALFGFQAHKKKPGGLHQLTFGG
jgi:hypothetical protein